MKNFLVLSIFSLILFLSSCEDTDEPDNTGNPNPGNPAAREVSIRASSFSPATITITAGTTVVWTNNDSMTHTVTSNNGLFNSGIINTSGTFSFTFPTPGTYTYVCQLHPFMTGTVVVQ